MVAGPAAFYPVDNFFPATFAEVMFQDFAGGNYRLAPASPYNNAGTEGRDIGADFDAIYAAQNGNALPPAAVSNVPWITITSGASGAGNGAVSSSVAPNTGPRRIGTMVIAGLTFTVAQDSGCGILLGSSSQNFPLSGGTGAVGVIAPADCPWTAVSSAPWLTITPVGSGSGSGTVSYTVAANAGPSRTGTLTIEGQTFTVTQSSGCAFSLSPTNQHFPAGGGMNSASVASAAGCAWTAVSNDAWITITSGASGSGSGTVSYTVAEIGRAHV